MEKECLYFHGKRPRKETCRLKRPRKESCRLNFVRYVYFIYLKIFLCTRQTYSKSAECIHGKRPGKETCRLKFVRHMCFCIQDKYIQKVLCIYMKKDLEKRPAD